MAFQLPRRTFLGGAGVAIGLPFLEAMLPREAAAAGNEPCRLLCFYVPCGIHMQSWTPSSTGPGYAVTPILQPLDDLGLIPDCLILSGLDNEPARPDGPGDHAAGTAGFLTCTHVNKSETNITNGTSFDQVYAEFIGGETAMPSMQLGIDGGGNVGGCDSGYGCAYARNISWQGNTPLSKLTDPQTAFDLLFGGFDPGVDEVELEQIRNMRLSVLDYALDDANALKTKLGQQDKVKLDEYLDSVRDLETRIEAEGGAATCSLDPGFPGGYSDYLAHVTLMNDIMIKAFECDRTRVISFMLGNAGSNRDYGFIGAGGGHHNISHHGSDPGNYAMLETIDIWEMERFAYLVNGLKNATEGDGTVLDNTILYFGSEIEDGNSHSHYNMPICIAGGANVGLPLGQHLSYDEDTVSDLYIDLLQKLGVDINTFGDDGTGPLGL